MLSKETGQRDCYYRNHTLFRFYLSHLSVVYLYCFSRGGGIHTHESHITNRTTKLRAKSGCRDRALHAQTLAIFPASGWCVSDASRIAGTAASPRRCATSCGCHATHTNTRMDTHIDTHRHTHRRTYTHTVHRHTHTVHTHIHTHTHWSEHAHHTHTGRGGVLLQHREHLQHARSVRASVGSTTRRLSRSSSKFPAKTIPRRGDVQEKHRSSLGSDGKDE